MPAARRPNACPTPTGWTARTGGGGGHARILYHNQLHHGRKKRYSDEELAEFRELINEKLRVAKGQYEEVMATLNKRNSNDIDDTLPTYHALEEGSTVQSLEELMNSAERLRKFITGLQAALVRIENKTYGICRVTKQLIPKERLRAVPHATLSIEAKLAQGK